MKKEKWKEIKGFEGLYEVSNYGRVRSWNNKGNNRPPRRSAPLALKGKTQGSGYIAVDLCGKTIRVHRLVAEAFIPNPNNYPEVLHWDDDPSNNCVWNLRWGSRKMNQRDRKRNRGHHNEGENHGCAKLTENDVLEIRRHRSIHGRGYDRLLLAERYGVSPDTVSMIATYKSWKHI